MADKLSTIYICCIAAGLAVPLISVLLGAVGGVFDFGFDVDADVNLDSPAPVNFMSICFAVVVFGAVGRLCLSYMHPLLSILLGLAAAVLAGWVIGKFIIKPLKRNRPLAQNIRDLRWKEGVVMLEIRRDFVGTITVQSATGSKVTYSASLSPSAQQEILPIGTPVIIVEVDEKNHVCVVSPLNVPNNPILR